MEERLTEIQRENEVLKRNVTSMAETQSHLTETNIKLDKELSELKQRVARSSHAVWDASGNVSAIRNDISGLIGSLTSMQQSMTTFRDDLTYLHNEHVLLENKTVILTDSLELYTLGLLNQQLQQRFTMLQQDIMQLKDRLTKLESEKQCLFTNKQRVIRVFTVQNSQYIPNVVVNQVLVFDQVTTNEGGRYNSQSGIFTADINGWYVFFLDIRVRYYNQICWSELVKNNVSIVLAAGFSGNRKHDHSSESNMAILHIQAGDHIWVRSSPGSGTSCGIDDLSSFSGILLNAD